MPLTDKQICNASAPAGRVMKLSDGEGLQLWVKPSGSKLWNFGLPIRWQATKARNRPLSAHIAQGRPHSPRRSQAALG